MTSRAITVTLTARTRRRHIVAVKQFTLITVVFVISFVPIAIFLNGVLHNESMFLVYNINHISNFFIYLIVNEEFRKEAKNLLNLMTGRLRCKSRRVDDLDLPNIAK